MQENQNNLNDTLCKVNKEIIKIYKYLLFYFIKLKFNKF